MNEYRKVVQFQYKNNTYNMYLDNQNKHFFLRVVDNYLEYITMEELLELTEVFSNVPNVMNVKKDRNKKVSFIPKIIAGGTVLVLTTTLLGAAVEMKKSAKRVAEVLQNRSPIIEETIEPQDYISISTEQNEQLEVDTYLESENLNFLFIYDMEYLDKALDYDNVSIDQLKQLISSNNKISADYKNLLISYSESVISKYPNIDLRTFYENLKTLEIVECDKNELIQHTLNVDSYGCYVRTENKIYVLKDYKYEKGTWAYQVIFHEFSHCLRTGVWDIDGKDVKVQVEGQNFSNTITAEALNSLFAVSLFDYEEKDIAYQLQSNYHKIMIDCMDNYSLDDYVTHSVSYYANKLDEFNQDDNYATVILDLIQVQYNDYHKDSIKIEQSGYYPIYEYIMDMYFKKHITPNTTLDEAQLITEELIEKITFDVHDGYEIDTNYFYEYCNGMVQNQEQGKHR